MARNNAAEKSEAVKVHPCNTPNCDGKISEYSVAGLCKKCYASLYNWLNKKTSTERIARMNQLQLYETRLTFLLTDKQRDDLHLNDRRPSVYTLPVLPGKVKAYRRRSKYKVMK